MGTFKYDTGNMTQLLYTTLHGNFLQFTDYNGQNVFRFSEHIDPTILLALPFYVLVKSPKTLMFVQSLFIILSIIPLFKISQIKLKNKWLSTLIVLIFLVSPVVGNLLVSDFHAVAFCILFILLAYLYLLQKKTFLYFLFFILAILSKENVAVSFIPFSFIIYFVYRQKKTAVATFLISVIYAYLAFVVLIPFFRGQGQTVHASFDLAYSYLGVSYSEIAKNLVFNPVNTFHILTKPARLKYFIDTFSVYGFLPIFAFPYTLVLLPELLLKGLSNIGSMRNLNYQYTAIITPFLYIATINFFKKFSKFFKLQLFILILILAFNLNYSLSLNNITIKFIKNTFTNKQKVSLNKDLQIVRLASPRFTKTPYIIVSLIPKLESVSAPNFMGAHLSEREHIAMYPAKYNEFQNVIVEYYNSSLPAIVFSLYKTNVYQENREYVSFLLKSKNYRLVMAENGLAYFKKANLQEKNYIPQVNISELKNVLISSNLLVTKPFIQINNGQPYLVTNISYIKDSDNPVIYTIKTISRQFQVMDLYQYANLNTKLEYVSVIPILLTEKELKGNIEVTVSEHNIDTGLTIKPSKSFVLFKDIKVK